MLLGTGLGLNSVFAAILFVLALQSGDANPASAQNNQQGARSDAKTSHAPPPALSDREKAGLRGPVEECTWSRLLRVQTPLIGAWFTRPGTTATGKCIKPAM
jgi:hypothetical protein